MRSTASIDRCVDLWGDRRMSANSISVGRLTDRHIPIEVLEIDEALGRGLTDRHIPIESFTALETDGELPTGLTDRSGYSGTVSIV